jgi:hypothetical protein
MHLAYVPDEMQARHPLPRLEGFGYRGSEATVDRSARYMRECQVDIVDVAFLCTVRSDQREGGYVQQAASATVVSWNAADAGR